MWVCGCVGVWVCGRVGAWACGCVPCVGAGHHRNEEVGEDEVQHQKEDDQPHHLSRIGHFRGTLLIR